MRKALLLLLLIVAFSGNAKAQNGCQPTVNFSDYDSVWGVTGPNGYPQATIYRSYQITGSAQMDIEFCLEADNATHHEVLSTSIGSASNSLTTYGHCVSCSFNDTVTTSLDFMPGDPSVSGDSTGSLVCSVAGVFYRGPDWSKYFETAFTYDKATDAGTNEGTFLGEPVYRYNVVHNCSNGTPDYNPPYLDDNNEHAATDRYFLGDAVLFRLSQTSTWSVVWPTGYATTNGGPGPSSPSPCTHSGPQQ